MTAPVSTVGQSVARARANVFSQDTYVTGVRRLIGVALGVNINSANTDVSIPLLLLGGTNFVVRGVMVNNAVINNGGTITNSVTTATAALNTVAAAGAGNVVLVTAAALSGLTTLTGSGSNLDMTLATQAVTLNQATQVNQLYFRTGTAQGASTSATVDLYIFADVLP